jgi:hypothetical protein
VVFNLFTGSWSRDSVPGASSANPGGEGTENGSERTLCSISHWGLQHWAYREVGSSTWSRQCATPAPSWCSGVTDGECRLEPVELVIGITDGECRLKLCEVVTLINQKWWTLIWTNLTCYMNSISFHCIYHLWLTSTDATLTACIGSIISRLILQRRQWFCQKHVFLSLRPSLPSADRLLGVLLITCLKLNLCTALTRRNTTENNSSDLFAQDVIPLQSNLLPGVYQLLGRSM